MDQMTRNTGFAGYSGRAVRVLALSTMPLCLMAQTPAQNAAGTGRRAAAGSANAGPSDKDTRPYDKHNFSGLWARNPLPFGQPACPECRDDGPTAYGFFGDVPPRTAAGEKKFEMNRPTKGFEPDSAEAKAHANIDVAYRRAAPVAESNDPEQFCEPL